METSQGLEIHHPVLQETDIIRTTVNMVMCHFPLPGEDDVVLFDGVLDHVGRHQDLLSMLLSVGLDTTNLCRMGSPLYFSIVHLKMRVLERLQPSSDHPPYPGFKLHYPG